MIETLSSKVPFPCVLVVAVPIMSVMTHDWMIVRKYDVLVKYTNVFMYCSSYLTSDTGQYSLIVFHCFYYVSASHIYTKILKIFSFQYSIQYTYCAFVLQCANSKYIKFLLYDFPNALLYRRIILSDSDLFDSTWKNLNKIKKVNLLHYGILVYFYHLIF
jgi:hypothetical protein